MEQELLDANQDIDKGPSDLSTQDPSSDDDKHIENEEDLDKVPFHKHPRFKELIDERDALKGQLNELSFEMQDLKTKVDKPIATDVDTQLKNMSLDQLEDLYDASSDIENINYEQLRPLRKNISKIIRAKQTDETVESLKLAGEKKMADMRTFEAYPDIGDPQSEIFKTTRTVMAEYAPELKRAGANIERMPRFLEICVNEAAKRLGIEAKTAFERGKNMEYDRQLAAGKAGLDTGKKKTSVKEPEISENLGNMCAEIGTDPKKVAARKKRLLERGR